MSLLLLALFLCSVSGDKEYNFQKMKSSGIIPDVIDSSPATTLSVTYGSDAVLLGNELTPTQVKGRPTVNWDAAPGAYYTLAMVDPDAPSRADPKFREVKHWLVGNINGSDMNTGDVIADYVGSGPPKGTGLHRYVYLLFEQKQGRIEFDEPITPSNSRKDRLKFSIRKFAEKYGLGEAVAGNFYVAQWDPYVEERNKNIKD